MNDKYFAVQKSDKSFVAYGPGGMVMYCDETCSVVTYCTAYENDPQYAKLLKACVDKAVEVAINPN